MHVSIDTSVNLDYEKYLPLRFAILHAKGILRELDFYIEDCSKRSRNDTGSGLVYNREISCELICHLRSKWEITSTKATCGIEKQRK